MYCSNCGHELKENARFCSNCGSAASNNTRVTNIGGGTFKGFIIKYRFAIIAYFIWFCSMLFVAIDNGGWWGIFVVLSFIYPASVLLLWLLYKKYLRQCNGRSNKNIKLQDIIVFVSLITAYPAPFVLIWLLWKKFRKPRRKSTLSNLSQTVGGNATQEITYPSEPSQPTQVYSLTRFASLHGKMSRVVEYDTKRNCNNVLFRFTNPTGTVITVTTSDPTIAQLTGTQIAEQKDMLIIHEYPSATYEMQYLHTPSTNS